MHRSTDRILTTHVGSLVRPPALRALIERQSRGETVDAAAFDALLTNSVAEVVARQTDVGIDIPSDGEFGKLGWTSYVAGRLSGLQPRARRPEDRDPRTTGRERLEFIEFYKAYNPVQAYDWSGPSFFASGQALKHGQNSPILECTGPLGYRDAEIRRDISNFKAALAGRSYVEAFLPVAAPESATGVRINRHYATADQFLAAMSDALKVEYRAIVDAGLLIQLDDAFLTVEYDRLLMTMSEDEVRRHFAAYVEMLNAALAGIPAEKVRYHVCWGSWNGPHTSDVPLPAILDLILKIGRAHV